MKKLLCLVLLLAPASVFADVVFYGQCEYQGPSVTLDEGVYTAAALQRVGIPEDAIASVKVPSGYVVTLYEDDGFSGRYGNLRRNDSCLTNDGFDKIVSSLKIVKESVVKEESVFGKTDNNAGGAFGRTLQPRAEASSKGSVTVYTECNFDGLSAKLQVGDFNLAQLKKFGIGDNEISSVKVPEGMSVTVYEFDFLRGETASASSDVACIDTGSFANRITSLSVSGGGEETELAASTTSSSNSSSGTAPVVARLFPDCNYRGASVDLTAGEYMNSDLTKLGIKNNSISAIQLAEGYEIELFINDFHRGQSGTLAVNNPCLTGSQYDDAISSVIVRKAGSKPVTEKEKVAGVYMHCNYKGGVVELPVGRHDATALKAAGVSDNAISSIKLKKGYQATLYDGVKFNGKRITITSEDDCLDDDDMNEKLSSIVIEPAKSSAKTQSNGLVSQQNVPTQSSTDDLLAGLTCVQSFVEKDVCDAERWGAMERRCGLSKVAELSDGYLQGHVEAGNCNAELWNELVRRTANPHLRER